MMKSRRVRYAGHVARIGEKRNASRILVGKPEGNRPLERRRRRWVDNIKMDLRDLEWDGMNCIDVTQDTDQWIDFVNTVMNLRVP
jgi:predicted membrane protein